jgi:hypothetical protein
MTKSRLLARRVLRLARKMLDGLVIDVDQSAVSLLIFAAA